MNALGSLAKMRRVSWTAHLLAAATGYLLGSVPSGYLVARMKGIDIRSLGSGNIGATNVFRILGNAAGTCVLVADLLKGWFACQCVMHRAWGLMPWPEPGNAWGQEWDGVLAGLFAVLGHIYTFWLRFRGGKGVATTAGVMLALVPQGFLLALLVWLVVFLLSRFVSLASIATGLALPWITWVTGYSTLAITVMAGIGVLAIYKHRTNIQRLLKGTEPRVSFRRSRQAHST